MKTRLLIIIGALVSIGIAFAITMMSSFDVDENMIYDNSPQQLEIILNHCNSHKDLIDTVGHAYYNDTHSINTVSCKWTLNTQIPLAFMPNPESLDKVLEYCNDLSPVKYLEVFYYYSNDTHSIDVDDCVWKQHQSYPDGRGTCIPYDDKWSATVDWNNKTHYFDSVSCKWKADPEFDLLNSKGCPQFCPKESTLLLDTQFEEIKSNIEKTQYDICNIRLENNTIIIDLHKLFKDSEPEKKIISNIPASVNYEIVYHKGYSDYFINTVTTHTCDYLESNEGDYED